MASSITAVSEEIPVAKRNSPPTTTSLLSLRSALILLLGLICGVAGGLLTYLGGEHWALAAIAAVAGVSGGITFFHSIISPDH